MALFTDYHKAQIRDRFLTDTCTIVDPGRDSPGTLNETTYEVTYTETEVYSGVCAFQPDTASRTARLDAQDLQVSEIVVAVPADTDGIEVGHLIRPGTVSDPSLEGVELIVTRVLAGTDEIVRELMAEDVLSYQSPTGAP